jgi:hypothetical protein
MQNILNQKNHWIVKHRAFGKSQSVFAGITMEEDDWQAIMSENLEDMTFQEWVPQQTIKGAIKDQVFNDYVTGTLLFLNDSYYGFGDFRTLSFPVINKVDHRKASSVILKNDNDIHNLSYHNKFI